MAEKNELLSLLNRRITEVANLIKKKMQMLYSFLIKLTIVI